MPRFPEESEQVLREAGWTPGRTVADRVSRWEEELSGFRASPIARQVLAEFGDVTVDRDDRGLECARMPFELDPVLASGEDDRFRRFEGQVGGDLFPLGEVWRGHAFLAISADGRTFIVGDEIHLIGRDFDDALDRMIRGLRPTRL